MAMLVPLAGQVGLQLLLEPAASPVVARGACCVFGEVLPMYKTYRALSRSEPRELALVERSSLLKFWSVYTSLGVLESITDIGVRFKGWYHVKLLLLLWLTSTRYRGAERVFQQLLKPLLDKVAPDVDLVLGECHDFVEKPEGNAFFQKMHDVLSTVPLINWFVRDPPPGLGND